MVLVIIRILLLYSIVVSYLGHITASMKKVIEVLLIYMYLNDLGGISPCSKF